MATKRSTSPQSARSLPLHLTQIAHAVRLICDARLPLHLGSKASHSHTPDDGGLRVSSVRMFPEVENDVAAYMSHFRFTFALYCFRAAFFSLQARNPTPDHHYTSALANERPDRPPQYSRLVATTAREIRLPFAGQALKATTNRMPFSSLSPSSNLPPYAPRAATTSRFWKCGALNSLSPIWQPRSSAATSSDV